MDSRGCKSLDEFSEGDGVEEFDGSDKTMRQEEESSVIVKEDDSEAEGELFL